MKIEKISSFIRIAAIVSAIFFFIYSLVQLAGYGISTGAIPNLIFLSSNFQSIVIILLIILLITSTIIYFGFITLSKEKEHKFPKASAYALTLINLMFFLLNILFYSSQEIFNVFGLNLNIVSAILGATNIWFGFSLIYWKNKNNPFSKSLGIFYVLQGIILLSTLWIPLRLAEFTIAIRILESFFFSVYRKYD
jgi:hypothetical protein